MNTYSHSPLYTDVDECSLGLDNCHPNAYCTNFENGFNCTCDIGYSGDGLDCESMFLCSYNHLIGSLSLLLTDIDECSLGTDTCDIGHADCTDTEGSYSCTCHIGYTGNGELCCMSM